MKKKNLTAHKVSLFLKRRLFVVLFFFVYSFSFGESIITVDKAMLYVGEGASITETETPKDSFENKPEILYLIDGAQIIEQNPLHQPTIIKEKKTAKAENKKPIAKTVYKKQITKSFYLPIEDQRFIKSTASQSGVAINISSHQKISYFNNNATLFVLLFLFILVLFFKQINEHTLFLHYSFYVRPPPIVSF